MHNMRVWLHMRSRDAFDGLFPLVLAADDMEDASGEVLGGSMQLCASGGQAFALSELQGGENVAVHLGGRLSRWLRIAPCRPAY